jgi:hypothetical protein
VVKGEAKSEAKEVERQAQARRFTAAAETNRVVVEGEAKSEAKR